MIAPKNNNAATPATKTDKVPSILSDGQQKLMLRMSSAEIQARLKSLLTDKNTLDMFIAVMTGLVRTNPKLGECTESSFVSAMIKCATLRLIPNDSIRQHCWLIPRWNKKTGKTECNWEAGWKGLIELGYRTDEVTPPSVAEIYQRDEFSANFGTNKVHHTTPKENRLKRGEIEGFWAQYHTKDGADGPPVVMSMEDMVKFKEQYAADDSDWSPWKTAFNEMAKKTVIKRAYKTAPMSNEDLRQGLDESPPEDNPKYRVDSEQKRITGTAPSEYKDPMYDKTIDAEYEAESAASAAEPEPEKPAKKKAASDSVFDKVEQKIKERMDKGQTPSDIEALINMELKMDIRLDDIEALAEQEQLRIYQVIK